MHSEDVHIASTYTYRYYGSIPLLLPLCRIDHPEERIFLSDDNSVIFNMDVSIYVHNRMPYTRVNPTCDVCCMLSLVEDYAKFRYTYSKHLGFSSTTIHPK